MDEVFEKVKSNLLISDKQEQLRNYRETPVPRNKRCGKKENAKKNFFCMERHWTKMGKRAWIPKVKPITYGKLLSQMGRSQKVRTLPQFGVRKAILGTI